MPRSSAASIALLVALACATAWAFSTLIGQRFSGGEVYPPCSTLRADPLGAKALHDALDRLNGTTCERNFRRLTKLADAAAHEDGARAVSRHGHTLLLLGVNPESFVDGDLIDGGAVRDFATSEGRVVITLSATTDAVGRVMQTAEKEERERREKRKAEEKKKREEKDGTKPGADKAEPEAKTKPEPEKPKKKDKDDVDLPFEPAKSLRQVFGVRIEPTGLPAVPKGGHALTADAGGGLGAAALPVWWGRTSFTLEDKTENKAKPEEAKKTEKPLSWTTVAKIHDKPVLMTARIGAGSIVLASDSYFATNESLMRGAPTAFLAWLLGDARHVIFDETHLGTLENPGIVTLARRYRLHGFFLGGVLLFALFVWQSSSSLVPAQDGRETATRSVAGQGAVAALVSLLRRGVPRAKLVQTGFEQWLHGHPHPGPALQKRIEAARALLPPPETKRLPRGAAAALYQRLCETLHPNRR